MSPSGAASEVWRPSNEIGWVEAIRAGDGHAFEALFHAYHASLRTLAYRYLCARDLAEEIVQAVFLVVRERREIWEGLEVSSRRRRLSRHDLRHVRRGVELEGRGHERISCRNYGGPGASVLHAPRFP